MLSALSYPHIDNSVRLDVVHIRVPEAQLLAISLTMPVVTVFCSANGLPIATTNSPGLRSTLWPKNKVASFV